MGPSAHRAGDPTEGGVSPAPHDDVRLSDLLIAGAISHRVHNALVTQGMRTAGDVRRHSVESLLELRNVGRLSISELISSGVVLTDGRTVEAVPPEPWEPDPNRTADTVWSAEASSEPRADDPSDDPGRTRAVRSMVAKVLGPHPTGAGSLAQLLDCVSSVATSDQLEVLILREDRTLDDIARMRGVSRERIRQIESKAGRIVEAVVARIAPHIPVGWHSQLAQGIASEDALFAPYLDRDLPLEPQVQAGRLVLRSTIPTARPARVFGQRVGGYWTNGDVDQQAEASIRELAELGPYGDEDFAEAVMIMGIEEGLARLLLSFGRSPMYHHTRARGWVRRVGAKRDACYLILSRAGRPATAEVLARIVEDHPRNLGAQLERDNRFQKLYGRRQWALASWDNSHTGGRYRNTKEAMSDLLTRQGPMTFGELVRQVTAVHHVTSWAVSNNLENEVFGQFPDGRYGMAYQGAAPYEDPEPAMTADVDGPVDLKHISYYVPVSTELLRGSGIPVPRYVTWFIGLRRVPRKRSFETADGGLMTISRNTGSSSMSSLRAEAQLLRVHVDCLLQVSLDLTHDVATVRAVCPCHAGT